MEKLILGFLKRFAEDHDPASLDRMEEILFSLLLKRELFLLLNKDPAATASLSRTLEKFAHYRFSVFRRLQRSGRTAERRLLKEIFVPYPNRMVFLLTHRCQLRCRYCRVRKFSADMEKRTLFKGIDLLFTSLARDIQIQFFGGEPLLEFSLLKEAVHYAKRENEKHKKNIMFLLTTNGIALTREKTDFLKEHGVVVEFSIDGDVENQLKMRRAKNGRKYYRQMLDNFAYLKTTGISHYGISVFMPSNVDRMYQNFIHLVRLGFKRLQMNYALGVFWPEDAKKKYFSATRRILKYVRVHPQIELINTTPLRREPVVLNSEMTLDGDGGLYFESGICLEEDFQSMKKHFMITHVDKAKDINRFQTTPFQNFYRLARIYGEKNQRFRKIIFNNIALGKEYEFFLRSDLGK